MQQTLTDLNRKMSKKQLASKVYALDSSKSNFITIFVQYMMDDTWVFER